jgi:coenzyme F420-reducing hydrogenase beta subunit
MNILSDISFLSICTGCGLCANICSNNAISMQVDDEGFLSPHIEIEKCNECGDCLKCCPLLSKSECASRQPIEVYACQIFDKKLLIDATAGGLFPLLAQCILDQNGVVYGAAYDNNMKVVHCAAYNMEGVKRFSGSKYVQSDASKTFGEIKELLKKDKKVLFSGTPCQVDAVIRYCDYSELTNLYTVDVVC